MTVSVFTKSENQRTPLHWGTVVQRGALNRYISSLKQSFVYDSPLAIESTRYACACAERVNFPREVALYIIYD
jgi:hypothetical protein